VCPSLTAMCSAMTKHSPFVIEEVENIGIHYARTLKEWRDAFMENFSRLRNQGFDERFKRMWTYYLSYCEAGFASRKLNTLQFVATRSCNTRLPGCPGYQSRP